MMRLVYWGTYDEGKPRNRILLKGLRENGVVVHECHRSIWAGIEDKSRLTKWPVKLRIFLCWLLSYPKLVVQYLRAPQHDCVVVGYLGHLDVLVLWPFARMRNKPVVWDAFISLYDTVVNDRKMLSASNPAAYMLYWLEWLACRAADRVVLDTAEHAAYFVETYALAPERCMDVLVGAEPDQFAVVRRRVRQDSTTERAVLKVLFYGQFIPLHGIETIVQAAQLLEHNPAITWTLIGRGQEESKIERILEEHPLPNLRWVKWVEYHELRASIHEADVCLGIFGTSGKASRVIPNKVFQVVSCGKTLITRDSPAIRELISENEAGIFLIPPGDPQALADTLAELSDNRELLWQEPHFSGIRPRISPQEIGNVFKQQILGLIR